MENDDLSDELRKRLENVESLLSGQLADDGYLTAVEEALNEVRAILGLPAITWN